MNWLRKSWRAVHGQGKFKDGYDAKTASQTASQTARPPKNASWPDLLHPFLTQLHYSSSSVQLAMVVSLALLASVLLAALRTSLALVLGRIFAVVAAFGSGAIPPFEAMRGVARWSAVMAGMTGAAWVIGAAWMGGWVGLGETVVNSVSCDSPRSGEHTTVAGRTAGAGGVRGRIWAAWEERHMATWEGHVGEGSCVERCRYPHPIPCNGTAELNVVSQTNPRPSACPLTAPRLPLNRPAHSLRLASSRTGHVVPTDTRPPRNAPRLHGGPQRHLPRHTTRN